MIAAPHIIGMPQRVAEVTATEQQHIEQAIIEISIRRKFGEPAEIMADVRRNRKDIVTFHLMIVRP